MLGQVMYNKFIQQVVVPRKKVDVLGSQNRRAATTLLIRIHRYYPLLV